jgi:hypothetical protein
VNKPVQAAPHKSLSGKIHAVLNFDDDRLSIGTILNAIGSQGFGLLLIIVSLPSAVPVPGPGYSTPLGCLIVFLGLQMVVGRRTPWLPQRCRRWSFSAATARAILRRSERFFRFIERFVRPRLFWLLSPVAQRMFAIGVIVMGMLMIVPIPLTNTLPAVVVFLVGVSVCERDGLVGIAAGAVGIAAVCLYAVIIALILYFILHLKGDPSEFIEWLKSSLSSSPAADVTTPPLS